MEIICKWVFLCGKDKKQTGIKYKPNIEKMNSNQILNLITDLLAKDETIRIIFEKEKHENNNKL